MTAPCRIVILGGGTAGWMAANLMAKHWRHAPVDVTLVESPDIGIIGVGEGSTPTLKRFFSDMGIAEKDWMPACNATYKVNIRFRGWSPQTGIESYSHPFISQLDTFSERPFHVNCQTRRLGLDVATTPEQFLFNGWLANRNLAPVTPANFPFRIEYGYHFDSGLLGEFLKQYARNIGVNHQTRNVTDVECHADGSIKQLHTSEGDSIEGDLFIDCSGFRSVLLQQTLGVKFNSFSNNLYNDSAVVFATAAQDAPPVETLSTALSNGWAWQIPLTNRTGNGYVYSSRYQDKTAAEAELRHHLGLDESAEARHLTMKVGQVEKHWFKNCLGLGLSQGFIEPLEATALHLVQLAIEIFIDKFDKGRFTTEFQHEYNALISERFERVRDYIVAHYKLNTRNDSDYWRDNRNNMQLSESLLQILDVWYRQGDLPQEIKRQNLASHFGTTSWHCLLAGYGIFPPVAPNQPGTGDMFDEHDLGPMFAGSMLNFMSHADALQHLHKDSP